MFTEFIHWKLIYFFLSLVFAIISGKILLPMLRSLKAGQSIREDGPKSHLIKGGTPTIGGIIFLSALIIVNIIARNFTADVWVVIFATFGFGAVGFIDDYIKVVKKRNLGLRAYQKLLWQIGVTLVLIVYKFHFNSDSSIIVPFINKSINLGILYFPFILFVVVGTVNSVNLTDGLDGLSSGVSIICLGFFAIMANKYNNSSLELFSIIFMGALLGFLYYNKYPAKVFMGDTGSLALGGAISAIAVVLNLPLILVIAGGVFVMETLSVIIQVVSFKTRGKRVFLMSPLHHHFEEKGWKERKVVITFYIAEIICCLIAYLIV